MNGYIVENRVAVVLGPQPIDDFYYAAADYGNTSARVLAPPRTAIPARRSGWPPMVGRSGSITAEGRRMRSTPRLATPCGTWISRFHERPSDLSPDGTEAEMMRRTTARRNVPAALLLVTGLGLGGCSSAPHPTDVAASPGDTSGAASDREFVRDGLRLTAFSSLGALAYQNPDDTRTFDDRTFTVSASVCRDRRELDVVETPDTVELYLYVAIELTGPDCLDGGLVFTLEAPLGERTMVDGMTRKVFTVTGRDT